jgi:hypothetical protein
VTGGQFQQLFAQWAGEGPEPEPVWVPPEWLGPPEAELGWAVPISRVVARSDRSAVALRSATAYSTGVVFDLVAQARGLPEREANRLMHEQHLVAGEEEPTDALLRVGFELGDGSRISNLGRRPLLDPTTEPDGPVLSPVGGGGGSAGPGRFSMSYGYWLWPLPPPGSLRIYVEWPALDIALTHVELDADLIREAAGRAQALWE